MSYTIVAEVRAAQLGGDIKLNTTEMCVLLLIADTARDATRLASISNTELAKLTDLHPTTVSRTITKLIGYKCIRQHGRGNQYQSARYEILKSAHSVSATNTTSTLTTRSNPPGGPEPLVGVPTRREGATLFRNMLKRDSRSSFADLPDKAKVRLLITQAEFLSVQRTNPLKDFQRWSLPECASTSARADRPAHRTV